jgi:hypothetical protein
MNYSDPSTKMVFLSYASPDRDRVIPYYEFLLSKGFAPWMDAKQLLPGQNWEFEVKKAIDSAFLIVVFISENSVNRTGYVQKELRLAFNKLQERPFHHIYLVPVILDRSVPIPQQLEDLHHLYADLPDCYDRLDQALNYQLGQVETITTKLRHESKINFSFETIKESWDGFPGYDIEILWPKYSSNQYPHITQASEIIKGTLLSSASQWRRCKLEQMPDHFSSYENKFTRTNLFHTDCREPIMQGSILSQQVIMHWYGAGAAHPNTNFRTWCFFLEPFIEIESLKGCFTNPEKAIAIIQTEVRQQLLQNLNVITQSTNTENNDKHRIEWIETGTSEWSSFRVFTFGKDHLTLSFDPYQVASYAEGSQFAQIPYDILDNFMDKLFLSALKFK